MIPYWVLDPRQLQALHYPRWNPSLQNQQNQIQIRILSTYLELKFTITRFSCAEQNQISQCATFDVIRWFHSSYSTRILSSHAGIVLKLVSTLASGRKISTTPDLKFMSTSENSIVLTHTDAHGAIINTA